MTSSQAYSPRKQRRSKRHEIRGVDYCLNEWGDEEQPLLIYLHGWGDSGATFQFVVDELQHDWYVVAPDWRGFGRSGHAGKSYWIPDYLADLSVILDRYSPDAPVHLIGHSMGANIGGLFAGVFPERVRGFINVEGFGLADSDPANAPGNYRRWIESDKSPPRYGSYRSFDELAAKIQKRSPHMNSEQATFVATQWAELDSDGKVQIRADPAHKLPNAVQYRRAEAIACWDQVQARVLLVLGAETSFTAAAKSWIDADESKHPFRGSPTASIEAAGHMVHFEAPRALAAIIEAFVLDDYASAATASISKDL